MLNQVVALCQTDSLSAGDTIAHLSGRTLFGVLPTYRFHLATGLVSAQLEPLIRRSTDDEAQQIFKRYRRQSTLAERMSVLSWGAMLGGIWTLRLPEPRVDLTTGGVLLISGLVLHMVAPVRRSERAFQESVLHHNHALRTHFGGYYEPMFDIRAQRERLSLADSVQVKWCRLTRQYIYRGILVKPSTNLTPAFELLRNGRVTHSMRHVRIVKMLTVSVLSVAVIMAGAHIVRNAALNQQSPTVRYPLNRSILYGSAGLVGVSVVGIIHGNHAEARTMKLYNQLLREKVQ
jgi:hypothetical protein